MGDHSDVTDSDLEAELRGILEKVKKGGRKATSKEIDELIKRLLDPDSEWGPWFRDLLRQIILDQTTPGHERAKKSGLLEEPGMKEAKQPGALKEGKEAHEAAPAHEGETDIDKPIEGIGLRPDFYDPKKHHIRELKKNNGTEIKEGIRKLKLYKLILDWLTGKSHTMELTTWEKGEDGEYKWHDFILDGDKLVPKEEWLKKQKEAAEKERRNNGGDPDETDGGRSERTDRDRQENDRERNDRDRGDRDRGDRDRGDRDKPERGESDRGGEHGAP